MKRQIMIALMAACSHFTLAQNVGIGTNSPNSSAQLDVNSTTKGLLAPRMTTAQRNAIASPAKGLLVYDTDLNGLYHYNGAGWAAVGGGGGGFALPFEGAINLATPGFKVTNAGTGSAIQAITTNEFGTGISAISTTTYGYSVYAFARAPEAVSVYANADSATAVKAESVKGIAIDAISTDSTALRARIIKSASTDPVIQASHIGAGNAILASSQSGHSIYATTSSATGFSAIYGLHNGTAGTGVRGEANFPIGIGVYGASANGTGVQGASTSGFGIKATSGSGVALQAQSSSGTAISSTSTTGLALEVNGNVKISGGNTNPANGAVLTSDASGNATWQNVLTPKIGFKAYGIADAYNDFPNMTDTKVHFAQQDYDYGNRYISITENGNAQQASSLYVLTSGVYHLSTQVTLDAPLVGLTLTNITNASIRIKLLRNGITSTIAQNGAALDVSELSLAISCQFKLLSGDKLWVEVYQKNDDNISVETSFFNSEENWFSGFLVFAE